MGSREWAQVLGLGSKCLDLLNHLSSSPLAPLTLSYFLLTSAESLPLSNRPSFHVHVFVCAAQMSVYSCTSLGASTEEEDIGVLL